MSHPLTFCASLAFAAGLAGCSEAPPAPRPTDAVTDVQADLSPDLPVAADRTPQDVPAADAAAPDATADAPSTDADAGATDASDVYDRDAFLATATPCMDGGVCPAGSECFSEGCLRVLPLGARCEAFRLPQCGAPGYCLTRAGVGTCIRSGSDTGLCISIDSSSSTGRCDPGLACFPGEFSGGVCHPGLAVGAFCDGSDAPCNDGSSCQMVNGTARCVAHGVQGGFCLGCDYRSPATVPISCAAGSTCTRSSCVSPFREYCEVEVSAGSECGVPGVRCAAGLECASRGLTRVCAATGSIGTACRAGAPRCDDGSECVLPVGGAERCYRRVARGMACDPLRRTSVCATDGDDCDADNILDPGQCVAPGSAPGATCRGTGRVCDGALECSNLSRYRPTCRLIGRVGDSCDVGAVRVACPTGSRCVAARAMIDGALRATCTAPVTETEPNERTVTGRMPVGGSMLHAASLSATDTEDCYPVRIAANASLYLEVNVGAVVLSLFDASGTELGRWSPRNVSSGLPLAGVSSVSPEEHGLLRRMAAGDYQVCARSRTPSTPLTYQLAIGILPP